MGSKVYNTMIPRNVRISEAPSYGKPVLVYDLKCVGSDAYLKLATEVIQRERDLRALIRERDHGDPSRGHCVHPRWRSIDPVRDSATRPE